MAAPNPPPAPITLADLQAQRPYEHQVLLTLLPNVVFDDTPQDPALAATLSQMISKAPMAARRLRVGTTPLDVSDFYDTSPSRVQLQQDVYLYIGTGASSMHSGLRYGPTHEIIYPHHRADIDFDKPFAFLAAGNWPERALFRRLQALGTGLFLVAGHIATVEGYTKFLHLISDACSWIRSGEQAAQIVEKAPTPQVDEAENSVDGEEQENWEVDMNGEEEMDLASD